MDEKERKKYELLLLKAKRNLIRDFPMFSHVLFDFKVEMSTNIITPACIETFPTKRILINPLKFSKVIENMCLWEKEDIPEEEIAEYLLLHEIRHIILNHINRGRILRADPLIWNIACDIVIEYLNFQENLLNIFPYLRDCLGRLDMSIMTAECIYFQLIKLMPKIKIEIKELSLLDHFSIDKEMKEDYTPILLSFTEYLKNIGSLRGNLTEEYDILLTKFDIIKYISNIVSMNLLRNEPTLKIPHRRQIALGLQHILEQIKPKLSRQILVAIDTSGSISRDEFAVFLSGVINATKECNIDLILWDVSVVKEYKNVSLENLLKKEIRFCGRGGTDLDCVMEYLSQNSKFTNLIILTDGLCDFTPETWYTLKVKPHTTLFYTDHLSFQPPKEWDVHQISVHRLKIEARRLR